ncbi:MAG: hypothetical protein ACLFWL_14100 [Candidatus Brocadiia bacterium]
MGILKTIDDLLRDRNRLYDMAVEKGGLGAICAKLLGVFLITTAVYGAVMGSFRCIHPAYHFSDFSVSRPDGPSITDEVAGLDTGTRAVYTRASLSEVTPGEGLSKIREAKTSDEEQAENSAPKKGKKAPVLLAWLLLYALLGAQLAWTLKPFLGTPYLPDTPPFRIERGNIFVSAFESFPHVQDR